MSLSDFREKLGVKTTAAGQRINSGSAEEETEEEILAKVKRIIG